MQNSKAMKVFDPLETEKYFKLSMNLKNKPQFKVPSKIGKTQASRNFLIVHPLLETCVWEKTTVYLGFEKVIAIP